MARARRPVNGPNPTQLLTPVATFIGPLPAISPPNFLGPPIPALSGSNIRGLSGVAPALPAQFFNRTLPAVSSNLNGNALANIGNAQDATMRAFNQIKARFFGTRSAY